MAVERGEIEAARRSRVRASEKTELKRYHTSAATRYTVVIVLTTPNPNAARR